MVSCFFLPHSPTSPDINAPDLSSGLRGRVGKGRGERLINISTARLLGGLIHTFPMFHPPPRIPIPAFSTCVRVAETRQCLTQSPPGLWLVEFLALRWREAFGWRKAFRFHAAKATTLFPGLKKLNLLHRQEFPGYLMTPRYKGWAQWRDWSSCPHAEPACSFLSSLIIPAHSIISVTKKRKKQPCLY